MKTATEKQTNLIQSLHDFVRDKAPKLKDDLAKTLTVQLEPHETTLAKILDGSEVGIADASSCIETLLEVKKQMESAAGIVRWKKAGNQWLLSGPKDVMVQGNIVTVTSRRGESEQKVGEIVSDFGSLVLAEVAQSDPAATDPDLGVYRVGDEYRVVRNTKIGQRVAFAINDDGSTGGYMGKRGLKECSDKNKLTLEEAAKVWVPGEVTNCMCCGTELSNPESVELGIGPICREKYF